MKKFEYKIVATAKFKTTEQTEKFLNDYGDIGWELVYCDAYGLIFKREL